jgi:hypothetical protein
MGKNDRLVALGSGNMHFGFGAIRPDGVVRQRREPTNTNEKSQASSWPS